MEKARYNKHKDTSPERTVDRISAVLRSIDIQMEETMLHPVEGLYSSVLRDANGWAVNGKGTTEAFCRASAFGEAMERLQSNYAYAAYPVTPEVQKYADFVRAPDEERIALGCVRERAPHIWGMMREAWCKDMPETDDCAMEAVWTQLLDSEVSLLPYYSLGEGTVALLPDEIISFLDGSNGLASGNTPEEALCQGLSEVFERYVCDAILSQKLVPPPIPRAYIAEKYPALEETMQRIEALGNFSLCVRDGSMGRGFPVVGIALIDKTSQRYHVKFGAHPSFAVALERCLTELLQGYTPGNPQQDDLFLTPWSAVPAVLCDSVANRKGMWRDNVGTYPHTFFAGKPQWDFQPWSVDDNFTNAQGVRILGAKLLDLAGAVYVRDIGYLGVPAYRIHAPRISSWLEPISARNVEDACMRALLLSLRDGQCDLSGHQRTRALTYLQSDQNMRLEFADNVPKPLVQAALLCDEGMPLKAAELLRALPVETSQYRCAAEDLELAAQGMEVAERDELLELFFGAANLRYTKMYWRGSQKVRTLFSSPLKRLMRQEDSKSGAATFHQDEVDAIRKRLKDRMIAGVRDQNAVKGLFE